MERSADLLVGGFLTARIVYFSFLGQGHIHPTLPVMRELARRGEQVVYYGLERFRLAVEQTGVRFLPYTFPFRMPERGGGPFARVPTTLETLLELTGFVLDGQLDQVRELRPTHIMYDSFAPWGKVISEVLRRPAIAFVPTILVNAGIDARYGAKPGIQVDDQELTAEWYASFRARLRGCLGRFGLREIPDPPNLLQSYGDRSLVCTSREFQPLAECFDGERFRYVGSCFEFRPDAPAFPWERLDGRPLVLVAMGTVYNDGVQFLRECMRELADGPWQVAMASGGVAREELGPAPANFIVRQSVPQIEILRRCETFVTHAGMNSVHEALYYGVPMVTVPQAADHFWISARTAELGAAVALNPARREAGEIRRSVAETVRVRRYADAAARVGESLRAAGGARKAAEEVMAFSSG